MESPRNLVIPVDTPMPWTKKWGLQWLGKNNCDVMFTVVFLSICALCAAGVSPTSFESQLQRGTMMCLVFYLWHESLRSGEDVHMKKPCKEMWRAAQALVLLKLVDSIFMMFQDLESVRSWYVALDSSLSKPLPEKNYAVNCDVRSDDGWAVLMDRLDIFVFLHFIGWMVRAFIVRDFKLLFASQVRFELMEYAFAHQLPNFNECWWDHWVLDTLTNVSGICVGLLLARRMGFSMHSQFGLPQKFRLDFWNFDCFNNVYQLSGCFVVVWTMVFIDFNAFYLKAQLGLPTMHTLNTFRIVMYAMASVPAVQEIHDWVAAQVRDSSRRTDLSPLPRLVILNLVAEAACYVKWATYPAAMPLQWKCVLAILFVVPMMRILYLWRKPKVEGKGAARKSTSTRKSVARSSSRKRSSSVVKKTQ